MIKTVDDEGKPFDCLVRYEFTTCRELHYVQVEHKMGRWRVLVDDNLVTMQAHKKANPFTPATHTAKFVIKTRLFGGPLQGVLTASWSVLSVRWVYELTVHDKQVEPTWSHGCRHPEARVIELLDMSHWAQGVQYFGYDEGNGPGPVYMQCTGVPVPGTGRSQNHPASSKNEKDDEWQEFVVKPDPAKTKVTNTMTDKLFATGIARAKVGGRTQWCTKISDMDTLSKMPMPGRDEIDRLQWSTKSSDMDILSKMPSPRRDEIDKASSTSCERGHQVWLHIYDLDAVSAKLNNVAMRTIGMGAFHVGVEVMEREWFFAYGDSARTGLAYIQPKTHRSHIYLESVCMGMSPFSEYEIKVAIGKAMDAWPASSYHILRRNCLHFAEDLLQRLEVPEAFPERLRCPADSAVGFLQRLGKGMS